MYVPKPTHSSDVRKGLRAFGPYGLMKGREAV